TAVVGGSSCRPVWSSPAMHLALSASTVRGVDAANPSRLVQAEHHIRRSPHRLTRRSSPAALRPCVYADRHVGRGRRAHLVPEASSAPLWATERGGRKLAPIRPPNCSTPRRTSMRR